MIILIHLLQHLGIPSGAAIAIVIAGRKLRKSGVARTGAARDHDRRRPRDDR